MTDKNKRKTFSEFYDRHIDSIYRFVYLKIGSKEVAHDLVSDVFVRVWEQIKSPAEINNIRAYTYQIARNLIVDYYRQRKLKKISSEELSLKSREKSPEDQAVIDSDLDRIKRALPRISEEYQNVLIFYYLEEMSVKEIAEIEGKSQNAVRVTIHRALDAIRKQIDAQNLSFEA